MSRFIFNHDYDTTNAQEKTSHLLISWGNGINTFDQSDIPGDVYLIAPFFPFFNILRTIRSKEQKL